MRMVIPTLDDEGIKSKISEHFGRALYFTVIDLDERNEALKVEAITNSGEHFGGQGRAAGQILPLNPQVVITRGMGPRAIARFEEAGVTVLQSDAKTVEEALSLYREGRLSRLTDGCHHYHRLTDDCYHRHHG